MHTGAEVAGRRAGRRFFAFHKFLCPKSGRCRKCTVCSFWPGMELEADGTPFECDQVVRT